MSLIHAFNQGGVMMYPILILGIIMLLISIERIQVLYFKTNLDKEHIFKSLTSHLLKGDLEGMLVVCVVNFPPKKIGNFSSEVLTLGFPNTADIGWVLITPAKNSVKLGDRLK